MGLPKGESKPAPQLRKRTPDPVFGEIQPLPLKQLPLVGEVG